MKNTLFTLSMAVCMLFTLTPSALADVSKDLSVMVNGEVLKPDVPPEIINDRTMVPMRIIFEKIGAEVDWDAANQKITAVKDDKNIELNIGSTTALSNGAQLTLDSPPVIIEGRTLVPLRFIADSLGYTVEWDELRKQARVWEMSQELLDAIKRYDDMYEYDTLQWLASLYDPETGGFYYCRSARDNEGFAPDVESTSQAVDILNGSGILPAGVLDNTSIPDDMRLKMLSFFQERQAEDDGYFYDIAFGKEVGNSKRERNLGQATEKVRKMGGTPLYKTPSERISELQAASGSTEGTEKKEASEDLSFLPEYLQSQSAYMQYVKALPWDTPWNCYHSANLVIADNATASNLGYSDAVREFIKSIQNQETGLWGEGLTYNNVNAGMKLSGLFTKKTEPFPLINKVIESTIYVVKNEGLPNVITDVWNPLVLISSARQSYEKFDPVLKAEIEESMVEMIDISIANTKLFKREDGGYSYGIDKSSPTSQGAFVGLGLAEGDVNATSIATQAMRSSTYKCLGFTNKPPFWDIYKDDFFKMIAEAKKPVKLPFNPVVYTQDFSDMELGAVTGTGMTAVGGEDAVTISREPYKRKINKVLAVTTSPASPASVIHTFTTANKDYIDVSFDFMLDETNKNSLFYGIIGNTPALCWTVVQSGTSFALNHRSNGSGYGSLIKQGLSLGEWHKFRAVYKPDGIENTTTEYFIDGESMLVTNEYYNGGNAEALPGSTVDRLSFRAFNAAEGTIYVDNIVIKSSDNPDDLK